MSIIVTLTAVDDDTADSLVTDPSGFQRFMLGGDLVFENAEERAAFYRSGIPPKSLQDAVAPQRVDMDKAWAAIHHVLAKQRKPSLEFIQGGGRDIRQPQKRGKKPGRLLARAFSSAEVSDIHRTLAEVSDTDFSAALDPQELKAAQVYPDIWDEHGLDYVLPWFQRMRAFLTERASRSEGILVSDA